MNMRHSPSHYEKVVVDTGIKTIIIHPPLSAFGALGVMFSNDKHFAVVIWSSIEVKMNSPASVNFDLYSTTHSPMGEKLLSTFENCGSSLIFSDNSRYLSFFQWKNVPYEAQLDVLNLATGELLTNKNDKFGVAEIIGFDDHNVVILDDPVIARSELLVPLSRLSR